MRSRGVALLVAVVAFASWPGVSSAQDDPTTTTVAPPTTDTTVPPATTVPEAPPSTTAPEPPPTTEPVEVEPATEGADTPRTVAVTPREDLVDGQVVVVRGRGWRPRVWVEVAQCRGGIAGSRGCGPVADARTDARGNFRIEYEVEVIVETPSGTYDCRTAPCVVRASDWFTGGSPRSVRTLFDPAGPDPVREQATINPDSDLVDGQLVTVAGDDFDTESWGGYGWMIQCRVPVVDRDDCDVRSETYAQIGSDGHLAATFRLEALPRIDGADVDCRTTPCALLVGAETDSTARAALVPLAFDPDAPLGPARNVIVTPGTDLRDGQIVDVDGEGLRPKTYLIVAQCRWGATDLDACAREEQGYADVRADGTMHTQVGLWAVFRSLGDGSRVNCRVTACSLTTFLVGSFGSFSPEGWGGDLERLTRTRLFYDPDAPLLEPTIQTDDLVGVRAGSRWRIWGTGGRPEGTVVLLQCRANARTTAGCALGTRRNVHSHFEPRDRIGVSWEARYEFRRYLHLAEGRQIDCLVSACALMAMERGTGLDRSDRITTGFTAGG